MVNTFELEDHHIEQVIQACVCLDRQDEAREEIEKAGSYYTDRWGQPRPHPAHKIEESNKVLFCRIIRDLNLDVEETKKVGRPPNSYARPL